MKGAPGRSAWIKRIALCRWRAARSRVGGRRGVGGRTVGGSAGQEQNAPSTEYRCEASQQTGKPLGFAGGNSDQRVDPFGLERWTTSTTPCAPFSNDSKDEAGRERTTFSPRTPFCKQRFRHPSSQTVRAFFDMASGSYGSLPHAPKSLVEVAREQNAPLRQSAVHERDDFGCRRPRSPPTRTTHVTRAGQCRCTGAAAPVHENNPLLGPSA